MVTINKNIIGNWKFRGVGDKGLLKANIFQEKCDPKREFQTVGGGGGGVNKMSSQCRIMDVSRATDYITTIKCWEGK